MDGMAIWEFKWFDFLILILILISFWPDGAPHSWVGFAGLKSANEAIISIGGRT